MNGTGAQPRFSIGAAGGNPHCPGCLPPLVFHPWTTLAPTPVAGGLEGTPGHVTITPFYWAPPGYLYTTNYTAIVNGYLANVAADSQKSTNVFSVGTQYYQQPPSSPIKHIQYVVAAGAEIDDTNPYPAQNLNPGCMADPGFTACISDGALVNELLAILPALSRPIDDGHVYMVLFPQLVETCFGPGNSTTQTCSTSASGYCAYHGGGQVPMTTNYLLYGNEPFPDLAHCVGREGQQAPNGDAAADAQVSLVSHEANETITDWSYTWYDRSTAGYENGDLCAYIYGHSLGGTTVPVVGGTLYNQVINGAHYYTQDEFSNEDFALSRGDNESDNFANQVYGCVQQEELPTAAFSVPSVAIGIGALFDGLGSTDGDNNAALTYSWSWGDGTPNSTTPKPNHTFYSPATFQVTLTVTDVDGWSGSVTHAIPAVYRRSSDPAVPPLATPGARTAAGADNPPGPRAASIKPAALAVSGVPAVPTVQASARTQSPQPSPGAVGPASQAASAGFRTANLAQHHAAVGASKVGWPEVVLLAVVAAVKRFLAFL